MKKLFIILVLFNISTFLDAKSFKNRIDSLEITTKESRVEIEAIASSINSLYKEVEFLSNIVDKQSELIGQEQSAIENSLTGTAMRLDIFSLILAVAGIFLGIYINRKENSIQELLTNVKKLEQKTTETKDDIIQLNEEINDDIEGLYNRLKKEETCSLYKRLVDEPLDIANIGTLLLARKIENSNFKYLILAYKKFKKIDSRFIEEDIHGYKEQYLLQFFQHFFGQAICHPLVQKDLLNFLPTGFKCAYESDVINSSNSLIYCLNKNKDIDNKEHILYNYIKELNASKYKSTTIPYEIITSKYNNQKELISIWNKLIDNGIVIPQFGRYLCERIPENTTICNSIIKVINNSGNPNSIQQ